MKFTITINQLELSKTNLDIVDASILDYLYNICSAVSQKIEKQRITNDLGVWTWIDYSTLLSEMPLLRIKDKSVITRRFKTIEKEGFIKIMHGHRQRTYVMLLPKVDTLFIQVLNNINTNEANKSSVVLKQHSELIKNNTNTDFSVDENGTNHNTNNHNTNKTNILSQNAKASSQKIKISKPLQRQTVDDEKETKVYKRNDPDKATQLQRVVYFLEDLLHTRIVTWGKQAKALDMMLRAGYNEKQITFTIKYMAADEFYADKGFDLMTVANNIDKIKAAVMRARVERR